MKIETREDALLHCFDLWLWCAVTGGEKRDWHGWKRLGGYLESCVGHCPACEYMNTGGDATSNPCSGCIIRWENDSCNERGTVFSEWLNSKTIAERKKWALEIAILALEAL